MIRKQFIGMVLAVAASVYASGQVVERTSQARAAQAQSMPDEPMAQVTRGLENPTTVVPVDLASDPVDDGVSSADGAPDCKTTLDLRLEDNAMIGLSLLAPCHPNERVVLRHAGLAITAKTLLTGGLFTSLPALATDGAVTVLFADGRRAEAAVPVPDLEKVHRFAVQWQAGDEFSINAFEHGADYGQPGHKVAQPAGDPPVAAPGQIVRFGDATTDDALLAQVYTFPADGPAPDLTIEAAITDKTCARDMIGETLESRDGRVWSRDLTLTMPPCDAVGGFLVLNNPAGGTTVSTSE